MFALHETTRKRICRTAFCALCVAPSLATLAWITSWHLPGSTRRQADRLGDRLQVQAHAADWRTPRPGIVRVSQLNLEDLASGSPLLDLDGVEWRRSRGMRVMSAAEVVVDCDHLDRLAERVDLWLAALGDNTHELHWQRLVFRRPASTSGVSAVAAHAESFALHDVQGRVERPAAGGVRLRMTGHGQAGASGPAPIRLSIDRPPNESGSATQAVLETTSAAIPARLLAAVAPGFGRLGPNAVFIGTIGLQVDRHEQRGGAVGRLEQVDLAAAMPATSPHALRGLAEVEVTEMRWHGEQITQLAGAVRMENGAASPSLIAAAAEFMLCAPVSDGRRTEPADPQREMLAIDRLAVRFRLTGDGLTLLGDFPADAGLPAGCLAVSGIEPLVLQPTHAVLPAGAWIQFLFGRSISWLPATQDAVNIAERLPLPQ